MSSETLTKNESPVEILFRPIPSMWDPKARYPGFRPGTTITIPAGSVRAPGHKPMPCDVIWERDIAVALNDGTVIYTDVFRPANSKFPLPSLIAWSPYGKLSGSQSIEQLPFRAGVPKGATTGWESFEAPDPGYWCLHGYAVITPDIRGTFKSEGDYLFWGARAAQDGYDFVEWVAEQSWSNGKTAFTGNSQLSIMQWFIAALRPPHLTAIAPWEALIDMYRNDIFNGGVKGTEFNDSIIRETYGLSRIEDVPAMADKHPLLDDYWKDKIPEVEKIEVPAYVVASWTNPVHARGTLWAWERLRSPQRWLRIHNSMEWTDYYRPESTEDLRKFFDRYLKESKNDWEAAPRVRYSVIDPGGVDSVDRPASDFPLPNVEYRKMFFDTSTKQLVWTPPKPLASIRYCADDEQDEVIFEHEFAEDIEFVGPLSLKLWVSIEGHNDGDFHFWMQKFDKDGHQIAHSMLPMPKPLAFAFDVVRKIPAISARIPWHMLYTGPYGKQRLALRKLDLAQSSEGQPIHAFDEVELVEPGEVVPMQVLLWPISMRFRAGEQLRLRVAGYDLRGPFLKSVKRAVNRNKGFQILHSGGEYDSHVLFPVLPLR